MLKADKLNIHGGHRKRLKQMVKSDVELATITDVQFLEYILSFCIPRKDTNPIAHQLLNTFGGLYNVFCANAEELFQIESMTENSSLLVAQFLTLSRRIYDARTKDKYLSVVTVDDAVNILAPKFFGKNQEEIYLLCTDVNSKIMATLKLSSGGGNYASMEMSKLIEVVARNKASNIIFAHNHPGGNLMYSEEDKHITGTAIMLTGVMGVNCMDHLIFTDEGYYSFFQNGLMIELYAHFDRMTGSNRSIAFKESDRKHYVQERKVKSIRPLSIEEQQAIKNEYADLLKATK